MKIVITEPVLEIQLDQTNPGLQTAQRDVSELSVQEIETVFFYILLKENILMQY